MTAITIRPATERDAPAMEMVMLAAFEASYGQFMPDEYIRDWHATNSTQNTVLNGLHSAAVAEAHDRVIGFAIIEADFIAELWVTPYSQGQGAGKALVQWAENALREAGYAAAHLYCYAANSAAQSFYAALGYSESDRFQSTKVPGGPVEVLRFSKSL